MAASTRNGEREAAQRRFLGISVPDRGVYPITENSQKPLTQGDIRSILKVGELSFRKKDGGAPGNFFQPLFQRNSTLKHSNQIHFKTSKISPRKYPQKGFLVHP